MSTPMIETRSGDTAKFEQEGRKLVGYAAVFDSPSENLGGFREFIKRGAFKRSIESNVDCRALVDHDTRLVLGRRSSGTLQLAEDSRGLLIEVQMPDVSYARDLAELMRRGDVSQMSFGFTVPAGGDEWGPPAAGDTLRTRTIKSVDLAEVSVVTFPAYPATEVSLRSMLRQDMEKLRLRLQIASLRRIVRHSK